MPVCGIALGCMPVLCMRKDSSLTSSPPALPAGIGLENVQMVELEEWLKEQGRDPADVQMLRIDELAELGCCCFCSILYIANEPFLAAHPDKVTKFMAAVKKGGDYLLSHPQQAWEEVKDFCPELNSALQDKVFERSFVYMSRDAANVPRDWNKVTKCVLECARVGK